VRIVALRHLPTTANRDGILQGSRDTDIAPPDASLLAAISARAKELASLGPFDRVLTSDLRRTLQTARLYGFGQPVNEPLLRELNFGEFEGKHNSELRARLGTAWQEDPRPLCLGERMQDFEARIKTALTTHSDAARLLIFGHGAWIRGLISISRHGDIRAMNQFKLENNELVVLDMAPDIDKS
jgi:broad specificity phosphatase PhoE